MHVLTKSSIPYKLRPRDDPEMEVQNLVYNLDCFGTSQGKIDKGEEHIVFKANDKGGEREEATEGMIKELEEEAPGERTKESKKEDPENDKLNKVFIVDE